VWVNANTLMQKSADPLQDGSKTPPISASFPSYTQQPLVIPTSGKGVGKWQNDLWIYTGDYDIIYVYIFYKTLWDIKPWATWPPP